FNPDLKSHFDNSINFWLSILVCLNVFIFFRTCLKIFKSWVRYDLFFVLGFLILHFQIPFLASIGIEPENPDFIWINKKVVNYATWLSTLCILFWILGFLINARKKYKFHCVSKIDKYRIESKWLDKGLVIFFVLFLLVVGNSFLSGSYNVDEWGTGATYIFLLLKVIIFLKIIYFYRNLGNIKRNRQEIISYLLNNKVFIGILVLYTYLFLVTGDRGPVLQIASINIVAYTLFYKHIKGRTLIVFFFIGAVLFGILREGRTRDASERSGNIFSEGYEAYLEQKFNPTEEFASSVRILYRALDVVPEQHPYLYGTTLISNTVDVIPFSSVFYDIPIMYRSSTLFFTVLGQGEYYSYGEGSEIIADLYINLGPYLTILVFFIFGYFISFLTFDAHYNKNHISVIIYLVLITVAFYINRSTFLNPLKIIVYTIIIDKLFSKQIKIE
ncbi:MAG: O-antigen polysaccharide polymerase Wzy, partial [Bacteroidetes bacterium]|nr:O-antigen polysaccharide polymerase Wzy [Bacteroidota bacterium]